MGKVMESFGAIDGYDLIKLSKRKTKNDDIFIDIIKKDKNIKEEIRTLVNETKGVVFVVTKNKIIKGAYLFNLSKKDGIKKLDNTKNVLCDDISEETKKKYDDFMLDFLKDSVSGFSYDEVSFNDKVIKVKASKKTIFFSALTGFIFGMTIGWTIGDNFVLGILDGIVFGIAFSAVDVVVINKKKKKTKN